MRPSIALITTPISQGSGVLIDGGYVVTNAHVIDPYGAATVHFENDSPIGDVPVIGSDPYADIALPGPLELERQPLPPSGGYAGSRSDFLRAPGRAPGRFGGGR